MAHQSETLSVSDIIAVDIIVITVKDTGTAFKLPVFAFVPPYLSMLKLFLTLRKHTCMHGYQHSKFRSCIVVYYCLILPDHSGSDPGFGNGGAKLSSEASYIYERSELRAKRVMSEASINQLGVSWGS